MKSSKWFSASLLGMSSCVGDSSRNVRIVPLLRSIVEGAGSFTSILLNSTWNRFQSRENLRAEINKRNECTVRGTSGGALGAKGEVIMRERNRGSYDNH